jgi:hypothetical protein
MVGVLEMAITDRRKLGAQKCQCGGCGEFFRSDSPFDKHRTGSYAKDTRHCKSVADMWAEGFTKTADDWWIAPTTEKERARAETFWRKR